MAAEEAAAKEAEEAAKKTALTRSPLIAACAERAVQAVLGLARMRDDLRARMETRMAEQARATAERVRALNSKPS